MPTREENRISNLQFQIDYLCEEIAKALRLPVQLPADTVASVRQAAEMLTDRDRAIASARADEREKAAKIAEGMLIPFAFIHQIEICKEHGRVIAAAIRKGESK